MPHLGLGIVTVHKRIFHNEWKFLWKTLRTQKINGLAVLFRSFMTNVHKWDRNSHFCVVISDQHKALLGFSRNGNFCCAKFALFYPFFCCKLLRIICTWSGTTFAQYSALSSHATCFVHICAICVKNKIAQKQQFAKKINPNPKIIILNLWI